MRSEFAVHVADEEVRLDLANLAEACRDTLPFMEDVAAHMMGSIGKNFDEEASPSGEAWVPLSETTVTQRRKNSSRILQDTGQHLKGSINPEVTPARVRIGPSWKLAPVHQFGTNRAGRGHSTTIPARPFLGFRPEDQPTIEQLAKSHVEKALR